MLHVQAEPHALAQRPVAQAAVAARNTTALQCLTRSAPNCSQDYRLHQEGNLL